MSEKRKAVIKTRQVVLAGDWWDGWAFTVKTNPNMEVVADLLSGNLDRMMEAAGRVIVAWDFVDENGDPLPQPAEGGIKKLPTDLFQAIAAAAGNAPFETPPNS